MDMNDHPVTFEVERPERFDRAHVFLRLLILIAASILVAFGWLVALIYLVIPVLSAAFVSRDGSDRFMTDTAPRVKRYLHWIVSADAYFAFLTDRIPVDGPEAASRMEIAFDGKPTVGSALLRLLTSIPSAFVLALLGAVATITGVIAGVMILLREDYPQPLYSFHAAVVRWLARLLAYHASLTDQYPPFALDGGAPDERQPAPPAEQAA